MCNRSRDWLKTAVGPMGWRPSDFWKVTITEFFDAVDIFNEMHADPDKTEAPDEAEMAKLLEKYG